MVHSRAAASLSYESPGGTDVHARTVEHKAVVRAWVADLARRAGAQDPQLLARHLTLLIDGGLSVGVLDADPAAADAAKSAARVLVDATLHATKPRRSTVRTRTPGGR